MQLTAQQGFATWYHELSEKKFLKSIIFYRFFKNLLRKECVNTVYNMCEFDLFVQVSSNIFPIQKFHIIFEQPSNFQFFVSEKIKLKNKNRRRISNKFIDVNCHAFKI